MRVLKQIIILCKHFKFNPNAESSPQNINNLTGYETNLQVNVQKKTPTHNFPPFIAPAL